jgi:hypothetical protein
MPKPARQNAVFTAYSPQKIFVTMGVDFVENLSPFSYFDKPTIFSVRKLIRIAHYVVVGKLPDAWRLLTRKLQASGRTDAGRLPLSA